VDADDLFVRELPISAGSAGAVPDMTALSPEIRTDKAPFLLSLEASKVITASASAPPAAQCAIISEGESVFEGEIELVPGENESVKP
jgi:hypothetical protein